MTEKETQEFKERFYKVLPPDGDTINSILEWRGIYDCGKCFQEEEEEHYLKPMLNFFLSEMSALLERKAGEVEKLKQTGIESIAVRLALSPIGMDVLYEREMDGYHKAILDTLAILTGKQENK